MVFFCCNTCGGSFKKNQVDKHKSQCRCTTLSCMDCQKDFSRDDYHTHTKCVSEEQKYAAQGWQAPENRNKGEKKQMAWVEIVQDTVRKAGASLKPAAKTLLHHLTKHENVPRKKPKFFNFVANVGRNRFDQDTVGLVWDLLESEWKAGNPNPPQAPAAASETIKTEPTSTQPADEDTSEKKKKKKKKDKKKGEENEGLIADNDDSAMVVQEEVKEDKQKKKKRKRDEVEAEAAVSGDHQVPDSVAEAEEPPKKKKKKKDKNKDEEAPAVVNGTTTNIDNGPADSTTNGDIPSQESSAGELVIDWKEKDDKKKKKKKKNKQEHGDYALLEQSITENDDSLMAVDEGATKKKKKKKDKERLLA